MVEDLLQYPPADRVVHLLGRSAQQRSEGIGRRIQQGAGLRLQFRHTGFHLAVMVHGNHLRFFLRKPHAIFFHRAGGDAYGSDVVFQGF